MLDELVRSPPAAVRVQDLAAATGCSPTSGGSRNALSRLCSLEVAHERGELRIDSVSSTHRRPRPEGGSSPIAGPRGQDSPTVEAHAVQTGCGLIPGRPVHLNAEAADQRARPCRRRLSAAPLPIPTASGTATTARESYDVGTPADIQPPPADQIADTPVRVVPGPAPSGAPVPSPAITGTQTPATS